MATHVREKPPLRLHIDAEAPSGRHYRWGKDEPNAANVFSGLRFSDTMPGGFESLDAGLPRRTGIDYSDLKRLSDLRVIGAGGEMAGEYRLERAPRVSGQQLVINPSAVGWQAGLEDDKSVRVIYINTDLSGWQTPSTARQVALLGAGKNPSGDLGPTQDESAAGLKALVTGPMGGPQLELLFGTKGGPKIGRIVVATNTRIGFGSGDTSNNMRAQAWENDNPLTSVEESVQSRDATSIDFSPSVPTSYMALLWSRTLAGGAGTDGTNYGYFWRGVKLFGDTGIALQGTDGVLASDVEAHAVSSCPLLQATTGSDGTIRPSAFVIPHLSFADPTTWGEVIRQANRFELRDWAVWNDRTYYSADRGTFGRKWRARVAPAQLEETGPQLDRLWESVIVQYQDVDGTTRIVGPPGSGADSESDLLKDSDPENPANELGITRRDLLVMGTGTAASAAQTGARFLDQAKLLDSSGQAKLVGHVEDDRGIVHPYWRVRAGDSISFVDASDASYRRIVKSDKDEASRTCTVDLDAPPEGLQALLERLGVVLVPLGLT